VKETIGGPVVANADGKVVVVVVVVVVVIHTLDEIKTAAVTIPNTRLILVIEINFIFSIRTLSNYVMNLRSKSNNAGLSHVNTQQKIKLLGLSIRSNIFHYMLFYRVDGFGRRGKSTLRIE
jgi:hypothetical protein